MKVALIGFGNIGIGVEELIFKNREKIKKFTNKDISVKTVLIKNTNKKRTPFNEDIFFTDDFDLILNDEEIDTIIELTATEDEAFFYIKNAFKRGKNVITANKAVVSKYYEELFELSKKYKVKFLYEASVGGGVHIIKSILEDLPFNNIDSISGILNGTCNFILSEMSKSDTEFKVALKKAQELGFAEPDPTADISGIDTLRKTRILSSLIFSKKVSSDKIFLFGIDKLDISDIKFLKNEGYKLKLLGEGKIQDNKFYSYVMPVAVSEDSVFYNIDGATNIISYHGDNIKDVSFVGEGAGRYPTSDSILRDLLDIANENAILPYIHSNEEVELSNRDIKSKFYFRVPKEFYDFDDKFIEQKFEFSENIYAFTKELNLSKILDLFSKIDSDNYFLAKIE